MYFDSNPMEMFMSKHMVWLLYHVFSTSVVLYTQRHYQDSCGLSCQHGGPCGSEGSASRLFFCPFFKVVLVGPPGTGKSSMIHYLTTNTFKTFHSPTAFDNRTAKIEDGQNSYQLRWGVDNSYSFNVYISQCLGHRRKWRDPERHLLQGWRCDGLLSSGIWWRQSWNFEKLLRRVIPILQKDFPCWNKDRAEGCKRQSKPV